VNIAKSLRLLSNDFCESNLCTATKKRIRQNANRPRKAPRLSVYGSLFVCVPAAGSWRVVGDGCVGA
jgi:hypothetical protein